MAGNNNSGKPRIKPGGSITGRHQQIDQQVTNAVKGTPRTKSFGDVLKSAMKNPERKKNLQVQLNDAGLTTKKNTARQKLRLRKIKDKRK